MRQLPYRLFLWVFSISNAIVWFLILSILGVFLHHHFASDGRMSRVLAVRAVCLGLALPMALSLQGAILNLRVQFVEGRFLPPRDGAVGTGPMRNPWRVSVKIAALVWTMAVLPLGVALSMLLPEDLGPRQFPILIAGIGAGCVLVLAITIADREFRRYLDHIDDGPTVPISAAAYAGWHIAMPWGAINLFINAVLAWITYRSVSGGEVAVVNLRLDLVVMTFLISVFMALSALPEVECDVRRKVVALPLWLPSMPRLWLRYVYAAAAAALMYGLVTLAAAAAGSEVVSLTAAVLIKALASGVIAAGAAGTCALWALGRCANRRAHDVEIESMAPAAVL